MIRVRTCARVVRAVLAAAAFVHPAALADNTDPPVPPAHAVGGTPVALIGAGIDYLEEGFAARLTRDGEGEIIGYDFADDDRRPYAANGALANGAARIVLGEGQATSLVAIRTDFANKVSFSKALSYAGRSPARIIVVDGAFEDPQALVALAAAARYFYDRLFVVAAGDDRRDLDAEWPERIRALDNVVIVGGASASGAVPGGANSGAKTIDVSTDGEPQASNQASNGETARGAARSGLAAARIGALAARLRAGEPSIPATAMKSKITTLATQPASGTPPATLYGFIERPMRYFWLE